MQNPTKADAIKALWTIGEDWCYQ